MTKSRAPEAQQEGPEGPEQEEVAEGQAASLEGAVSQAEYDQLKERVASLEARNSALEKWKEEYLEAQEVYKLDVVTVMKELGNRISELQEGLTTRNNEVMLHRCRDRSSHQQS